MKAKKLYSFESKLPLAGKGLTYTAKEWKRIYGYVVGEVVGAKWMSITNSREEALKWWNSLTINEKLMHAKEKFDGRPTYSLTGREIEILYTAKCQFDKEIVDLVCEDKNEKTLKEKAKDFFENTSPDVMVNLMNEAVVARKGNEKPTAEEHEAACNHAGLKINYDITEETYYNFAAIGKYNAFIAGVIWKKEN